jgi:hypothetical protein
VTTRFLPIRCAAVGNPTAALLFLD